MPSFSINFIHGPVGARSSQTFLLFFFSFAPGWENFKEARSQEPKEVVIKAIVPQKPTIPPLTDAEQKRIDKAVEGGVDFLRRHQLKTGSWILGKDTNATSGIQPYHCPLGIAALGGLALLESGVESGDPAVVQVSRLVRATAPGTFRTYEISLAILFLDRLGKKDDRALIQTLGLRLAAGQTNLGGWGYNCPVMTPVQEKKFADTLRKKKPSDIPMKMIPPPPRVPVEKADNSNTQFAILGLWTARKHETHVDFPLWLVERRFRLSQSLEGWNYYWVLGRTKGYGSMTCVGLLALAAGRGADGEEPKGDGKNDVKRVTDEGLGLGLRALAIYMSDPSDTKWGGVGAFDDFGPKGMLNLYYLWSIERVAVFCNLQTIGGKDWYRWGVDLLLPAQQKDGSWLGRGSGGYPQVDTCFALLFLKKSDLLPDLRETLQKRLTIVDPGPPDLKGAIDPKKKTGDKSDPKKGSKDSPGDKEMAKEAPLPADLGEIKVGQSTRLPLRVRGPAAYKIAKILGEDKEVLIDPPDDRKEVHELIVLLRPQKTGVLRRTLIFVTDIPGRPEVAIEIKANVVQ